MHKIITAFNITANEVSSPMPPIDRDTGRDIAVVAAWGSKGVEVLVAINHF